MEFFHLRIQIRVHFSRFWALSSIDLWQPFQEFLHFRFPGVVLLFLFFITSLLLYVQRPNVDLSNRYKGFCKIRGRQRPPDTPSWAWIFGIETSSSSNLKLTSAFHSVWICDNSLQNFFISDVGTGDPRVSGLHYQRCRWRPSKMMGCQSLTSELRAGHIRLCPASEAGLDLFKT